MDEGILLMDDDTYFPINEPLFAENELLWVLGEPDGGRVRNWLRWGYVKRTGKAGRNLRSYSILDIDRVAILRQLVTAIGIRPSHAAEVVDFAIPYLAELFERNDDGGLKSGAELFVCSWYTDVDGQHRIKSGAMYLKAIRQSGKYRGLAWYTENPDTNPDAEPLAPPIGTVMQIPITQIHRRVFKTAAKLLHAQKRGGLTRQGKYVKVA